MNSWDMGEDALYGTGCGGHDLQKAIEAVQESVNHRALTCASNNHKFGTKLELRYKGRAVVVTVTDRMDRRLGMKRIDLSGAAFRALHPRYDMTDRTGTLLRGEWREVEK